MRAEPLSWKSERGQVLPVALLWILLLVALLAGQHAIGQAVNRRTILQFLADTGAYSGASAMAVGFNALARINNAIIDLWPIARTATTTGIDCSTSGQLLATYEAQLRALVETYELLNNRWREMPFREAHRVSHFNLYDLFPFEQGFTMRETDREMRLGPLRDQAVLLESTQTETLRKWTCTIPSPPYEVPMAKTIKRHFRKSDRRVKAFSWVVQAPAAAPQIGRGVFSLPVLPPMKAAAVAKPVGGQISSGRAAYVVKMLPFSDVGVRKVNQKGHADARQIRH